MSAPRKPERHEEPASLRPEPSVLTSVTSPSSTPNARPHTGPVAPNKPVTLWNLNLADTRNLHGPPSPLHCGHLSPPVQILAVCRCRGCRLGRDLRLRSGEINIERARPPCASHPVDGERTDPIRIRSLGHTLLDMFPGALLASCMLFHLQC